MKIKEKDKREQQQLGKIPPRRSRSQPTKKRDAIDSKIAWKKQQQKRPSSPTRKNPPRFAESRLLTARTRRTAVVAASTSTSSDPPLAASDVGQEQQQQQQQLTAKEVEKRKVKKIVDYVYTMDCAYGSIASKFTRISLNDDDDEDDGFGSRRRGGRTLSRTTSRSRVSYRGLTGILSGRASVMSDYAALPKTPKLMYGSLVSLRR